MCLAKAYRGEGDSAELILEDVARLTVDGRRVSLQSLFGERKEIEGLLREVDFQRSTIVVDTSV